MKRAGVTIIVSLLLLTASSMDVGAKGRFGIVGGFTSSNIPLKDVSFSRASGFTAGIAYNQPLILGFALQPQLIYSVKSTNILDVKENLGYLELPVQVQWGLGLFDIVRAYAFAEPFIGYALNGRMEGRDNMKSIDMDKVKSRFEYGLGVGAGVRLFDHVQVTFKYYWNFEASDFDDYVGQAKTRNIHDIGSFNGLVIQAGIFF